ncbi:MAG: hypothetical protein AB7P04_07605 [Bacteriovoracia bacterium]
MTDWQTPVAYGLVALAAGIPLWRLVRRPLLARLSDRLLRSGRIGWAMRVRGWLLTKR